MTNNVGLTVDEGAAPRRRAWSWRVVQCHGGSSSRRVTSKSAGAAVEDAGSWEAWRTAPVGTGPYRVKEFVFGERVVLEPFAEHWDEPAAASEVTRDWQMPAFGERYLAERPYPAYDGEQINYRTLQGYYTNELETAQILTSMWQDVGLNVELDVKENWSQINEDSEDRHIINGSFAQRGFFEVQPEFVKLGTTLVGNPETEARREAFEAMLDVFAENPHGALLHALTQFYGIRDEVKWEPYPTRYMDLSVDSLAFAG